MEAEQIMTEEKLGLYDVRCPVCRAIGQEYTVKAGHVVITHLYRQYPCRAPEDYRRTRHHGSCFAAQPDAKSRVRCDCGYRAAVAAGTGIPEHAPQSRPAEEMLAERPLGRGEFVETILEAVRRDGDAPSTMTPGEVQSAIYRAGVRGELR